MDPSVALRPAFTPIMKPRQNSPDALPRLRVRTQVADGHKSDGQQSADDERRRDANDGSQADGHGDQQATTMTPTIAPTTLQKVRPS